MIDMKENIFYAILGIVMIICVIVGVIVWCGIIYIGIKEYYDINPNSLFITIPSVIFVHAFGYLCFTRK